MARRPMYSFAEKKRSGRGITSVVLGGLSLLLFCVLTYVSFCYQGNAGLYVGAIGLSAMIFSFVGLVFGFMSLVDKHALPFFPKCGTLLNSVIFIGWLALFLTGIGK